MVANRKPTGLASSMCAGLGTGVVVSLGVTVAGSVLLANLVSNEILPESKTGYGIMVLLFLASWGGAKVSEIRIKRRKWMVSLVSAGIFFLSLLMITALFFGGQYSGVGETGLLVLCGGVLAGMTGSRRNRGRKTVKIKR